MSNKGGNYKKQAERTLDRAVCNGKITMAEYYNKKVEVQCSNAGGVDDGHSCTKGNLPPHFVQRRALISSSSLCVSPE